MKKIAFLLIFVTSSLYVFAQQMGSHEYSGYIAGKYPITLQLTVSSDDRFVYYSGTYYYNNVGKRLQLNGSFNPVGINGTNPEAEDYIAEYSDGKQTGGFVFPRYLIGTQRMNGIWQDLKGKRLTVKLTKVY